MRLDPELKDLILNLHFSTIFPQCRFDFQEGFSCSVLETENHCKNVKQKDLVGSKHTIVGRDGRKEIR